MTKSSFYSTKPPATVSPQPKKAETSFYETTGGDYSASADDVVTFEILGF